jgi:hypothetical protein
VIFGHGRLRRSVSLLASGVLSGAEAEPVRRHLASCARCRAEHDAVAALLAQLERDPLRGAEPEVPLQALLARVNQRLDERLDDRADRLRSPALRPIGAGAWAPRWLVVAAPTALAAAVLVSLLAPGVVERFGQRPDEAPASAPAAASALAPLLSDDALARLGRNVAREQAAHYLAEAQDVLVNVAATPPHCDRAHGSESRVDLEAESRRSRELLARRALLVEADEAAVMSARPVLDDVSDMLREVAALEACARAGDLLRLREAMEKRQLLMKMRLMERELLG